jgi:aspartyl/asparaginyl beta-hydroxylase (cupin superfamily)
MAIKYYFIILIIIIVIIFILEQDRKFSDTPYSIKSYYYELFPLMFLGLYNSIVRYNYPNHIHKFPVENFKSDLKLKNNYKAIKEEAIKLYLDKKNLLNMVDLSEKGFSEIDNNNNMWKVFVIKWYDKISDAARKKCPITSSILDNCPDIHAVMFSILEPGKFIPYHRGPSTACLRYHLGLDIPKDYKNCYIEVNKEKFYWEEGKSFIFDDTYTHCVYNNTKEPRIILFADIERPMGPILTPLTRYIISQSKFINFVKDVNDDVEKKQNVNKETFMIL